MALTQDQFEAIITHRQILYFICPDLNSPNPHYFICVAHHPNGELVLSCCTSQFDTVKKLVERGRFPNSTLVYMPPASDNPFVKDTYINCNEYVPYLISELWEMYTLGSLSLHGELPLHSFEQILIGFKDSPLIEEDVKEKLPDV